MANGVISGAPQVDFYSMLSGLGDTIQKNRLNDARKQAFGSLDPNSTDFSTLATTGAVNLLKAGDIQGGTTLLNLSQAAQQRALAAQHDARDFAFRQDEARRSQGNTDRTFNLQTEPPQVRTLRAAGINPASPEGRKALFPRTDTPISATDKKAIFQAEDAIPAIQGTIENLNRALELNDKTFAGFGAGIRGDIASKLPSSIAPKGAMETAEWSKIMGPEALQSMASTLKGATTDFELRKFIEMLGDPATPAPIRKSIIGRMKLLSERKLEIEQSRVNDLRGGSYFKDGGGPGSVRQSPGAGSQGITQEQYQALPPGTPYTAPDGSQRVKR